MKILLSIFRFLIYFIFFVEKLIYIDKLDIYI